MGEVAVRPEGEDCKEPADFPLRRPRLRGDDTSPFWGRI